MTDTPTPQPPPQMLITYANGKFRVEAAGAEEALSTPYISIALSRIQAWARAYISDGDVK